jgi:acyl carrier protein
MGDDVPSREELWTVLHQVVAETVKANGIDAQDIERDSMVGAELGLTSVDTIHVMITLEERLGRTVDLESAVIVDGELASDMSMRELHERLCRIVEAT